MSHAMQTATDEDRELIRDHAQKRATFSEGDRVTMEPKYREGETSIAYAGHECEGMPLTVESVGADDVRYADEYAKSEHPDDVLTLSDGTEVYVGKVRYHFYEGVHSLTETGLIPWDEYKQDHDRIYLPPSEENPQGSDTEIWLEPHADGGKCEVCGCNLVRHSFWDNGVVSAGRESCPACGEVFSERYP